MGQRLTHMKPGKTFLSEIYEQPEVLANCLATYEEEEPRRAGFRGRRIRGDVVFTGMGASLYASLPAMYYLNERGIRARAVETSELVYYGLATVSPRDLLVVISQSGETIEVRRLLGRLPRRRPRVVGITNQLESTLGRGADLVLPLVAGEQGFASSKTYSASVLVALLVAALWSEGTMRRLLQGLAGEMEQYRKLLAEAHEQARTLAESFRQPGNVVLLGRGPSLASALAGALLFKEVCALPAEGMSGAQFRHGPLELLARPLVGVLFAPPGGLLRVNRALARELMQHGARVLWVSSSRQAVRGSRSFLLPRPRVRELMPLFEIVPLQLLTWELARRVGREPGRLRIASNVTLKE